MVPFNANSLGISPYSFLKNLKTKSLFKNLLACFCRFPLSYIKGVHGGRSTWSCLCSGCDD